MLKDWLLHHFDAVQIGVAAAFVLMAFVFFGPRSPESGFKVREADRLKNSPPNSEAAPGQAGPLRLEGIRLDGAPHEVLGISPNASKKEVQKAYRDLMKRYHPDKIGRPGTREWQDAQKIAEALNLAKDSLLKRLG